MNLPGAENSVFTIESFVMSIPCHGTLLLSTKNISFISFDFATVWADQLASTPYIEQNTRDKSGQQKYESNQTRFDPFFEPSVHISIKAT